MISLCNPFLRIFLLVDRFGSMALVESEVAFKKRCDELEADLFQKFKDQDIVSFSTLAFTLGSPQNPVDETELSNLAAKIHGGCNRWKHRNRATSSF